MTSKFGLGSALMNTVLCNYATFDCIFLPCLVCFTVFDGDCDGWLSREELVAAIAHLMAMRASRSNATPITTTTLATSTTLTVSGETDTSPSPSPAPEDPGKEEIADSALHDYGKTKVMVV